MWGCVEEDSNLPVLPGQGLGEDGAAGVAQGLSAGSSGGCPSLVNIYQSTARRSEWSRKQKRQYQRLRSWLTEKNAANCQLLRVDLTTASDGAAGDLTKHFLELKRRVLRRYGYDIDFYKVRTCEGFGVLHMVWAIDARKAAWIDHSWLKEQWLVIHGASVVWIKRMGQGKSDRARLAGYMVTQYFVNQGERGSAVVRVSYSWWKCRAPLGKAWMRLKREYRFAEYRHRRAVLFDYARPPPVVFKDLLDAWEMLLATGKCVLAGVALCIYRRELMTEADCTRKIFF